MKAPLPISVHKGCKYWKRLDGGWGDATCGCHFMLDTGMPVQRTETECFSKVLGKPEKRIVKPMEGGRGIYAR